MPQILAQATIVQFSDRPCYGDGAGLWYLVHRATVPNLVRALIGAGWRKGVLAGDAVYERPGPIARAPRSAFTMGSEIPAAQPGPTTAFGDLTEAEQRLWAGALKRRGVR